MSEGPSDPFSEIARAFERNPNRERERLDEHYRVLDEIAHGRTLTDHNSQEMIQVTLRSDPEYSRMTFERREEGWIHIARFGHGKKMDTFEYRAYEDIDAAAFGEGRFYYAPGLSPSKDLTREEATILMTGIIDGTLDLLQTERALIQVIHG